MIDFKKYLSIVSVKEGSKKLLKHTANTSGLFWLLLIAILAIFTVVLLTPSKKESATNIVESDLKDKKEYERISSEKITIERKDRYIPIEDQVRETNADMDPISRESVFGVSNGSAQVIENKDSSLNLQTGTIFKVALANKIRSNSLNQPVIAIVDEAFYDESSLVLEAGTKLIGKANHDEASRRVQVEFHTIIYPDGTEKDFSAIALDMGDDGSSGLSGEYHSESTKRTAGSLLSYFISGLSSGFKDKEESLFGSKQKGSWKNGVFEGVSRSAESQAQRYSESLSKTKGFIEIEPGYEFLVFINRPFSY